MSVFSEVINGSVLGLITYNIAVDGIGWLPRATFGDTASGAGVPVK